MSIPVTRSRAPYTVRRGRLGLTREVGSRILLPLSSAGTAIRGRMADGGSRRRVEGRLPADGDDAILRVGHRDVGGLPGVVVVGEAVLLAVDRVLVPERGVVVSRSGLVEVGRVLLLCRGFACDVPVQR